MLSSGDFFLKTYFVLNIWLDAVQMQKHMCFPLCEVSGVVKGAYLCLPLPTSTIGIQLGSSLEITYQNNQ